MNDTFKMLIPGNNLCCAVAWKLQLKVVNKTYTSIVLLIDQLIHISFKVHESTLIFINDITKTPRVLKLFR